MISVLGWITLSIVGLIMGFFFICSVIGIFKKIFIKRKYIMLILILLAFMISGLSFFLEPAPDSDLSRYYSLLDESRGQTIRYFFTDFKYKSAPITTIWFYFVSLIGNNHFLPTLPTLITFGIVFYICYDFYLNKTNQNFAYFCLCYLCIFSFTEIIFFMTTVRYCTAAAFVLLAIYRDVYKQKHNWLTILIYCFPLLIHNNVILLLTIRLLCLINLKFLNVIFLLSCTMLQLCAKLLQLSKKNKLIKIGDLLIGYVNMDPIDNRYVACICVMSMLLLMLYFLNYYLKCKKNDRKYFVYNFYNDAQFKRNYTHMNYCMALIGFNFCSQLIRRINVVALPLGFSVLYDYLDIVDAKIVSNTKFKILRIFSLICIFIITIGMFVYQAFGLKMWRLCSV